MVLYHALPKTPKPGVVIVQQSYFTAELLPNWPELRGWCPYDIELAVAKWDYEVITAICRVLCSIPHGIQPPRKILVGGYLGNNHPLHKLMSGFGYEIWMKEGWRSVLVSLLMCISRNVSYLVYVGSLGHNSYFRRKTLQELARLAGNGVKIVHATHQDLLQKEWRENDHAILALLQLIQDTYGEVFLLDTGESLSRGDLTAYH